ncbi:MAG: AMP-binding protein [Deltaproteobacteria bacterium]
MGMGNWTVGDCLRMSAARWPGKTILKDHRRSVTYEQLDARVNQVANALGQLGLQKGDTCAFMLYNCMELIEVFYGLARAGIVGVPINFRNASKEIEYLVRHSDSKALVVGEEFLERITPLVGSCIDPDRVLVVGTETAGRKSYHDYLSKASDQAPSVHIDGDHVWYIGYTSGTTDNPKGVPTRHRAILENATQWLVDYGRYGEDDRFMLVMPLFHANAIMCSFLMITVGGTLYLHHSGQFDAEEMLGIIDSEKITITSVVPTMLNLILHLPSQVQDKFRRTSVHTILVASAPLWTTIKEGTLNYFSNTQLFEAYGSTEHQIVTVLKPKYQWEKIRSIGKAITYKEVKLLDDNGDEVPAGQPGELYARGWGIPLREYYKDPEGTAKAYRGDWSTVGDIAVMDAQGFFYLVDRKKDMIISGGENISPSEIENQIAKHPAVREVAVIGQPDEKWGEAVTAVVALREGMEASAEDIKACCEGSLARLVDGTGRDRGEH